jgi:tetratricopeptide (TPR) repeat protein
VSKPAIFAAALCLALASASARAELTESERRLLHESVSADAAQEYGKSTDAAALERLVALGDPALVGRFDIGMRVANVKVLPAAVEAVVIAHFDDPRAGKVLRAFTPRYQSRKLFDLHYARILAAYRNDDPSFKEILNTDQPDIDDLILKAASKFPVRAAEINPAIAFLAARKHPGALPSLMAQLEASYRDARTYGNNYSSNPVVRAIVAYPSPEAWRALVDEIDRLKREGRIPDEAHAAAHKEIDALLVDPAKAIAERSRREAYGTYMTRRDELAPGLTTINALRDSDPRRHAELYAERLKKLESIAEEYQDERTTYDVAFHYYWLGMHVRFRLREPQRAVGFLEKAARGHHALGQVALADTYQFDLGDKARALEAYRRALDEASKERQQGAIAPYSPPGRAMNDWWQAWLAAEIRYLETGQAFRGAISESAIEGFFGAMFGNSGMATIYFPDLPQPASAEDAGAAEKLPASRLALMAAMQHVSLLPDAGRMLRHLERNDPSGYWSACMLGTALYYGGKGAAGREEAAKSGAARYLPGIVAAATPNPILVAARRFMDARALDVRPQTASR